MPLELHTVKSEDLLSWVRIRAKAYYGPTHDCLHSGAIRDSSIRGVAEARKYELAKSNMWHWTVIDTDLEPSEDDPPNSGGRTIAISAWSLVNEKGEPEITEPTPDDALATDTQVRHSYRSPELRMDAVASLFGPLSEAQKDVMGTDEPYFMLNSFATHPDHQGRGAGKLMLDWGLDKADSLGLATYLDATAVARPIYEKRGFKVVKAIEWDRVPWGGEGKDCHWCMRRPPGKSA